MVFSGVVIFVVCWLVVLQWFGVMKMTVLKQHNDECTYAVLQDDNRNHLSSRMQ